jgi:hypothetical protein
MFFPIKKNQKNILWLYLLYIAPVNILNSIFSRFLFIIIHQTTVLCFLHLHGNRLHVLLCSFECFSFNMPCKQNILTFNKRFCFYLRFFMIHSMNIISLEWLFINYRILIFYHNYRILP